MRLQIFLALGAVVLIEPAAAVNTLQLPSFEGVAADASDPFAFIKDVAITGLSVIIALLTVIAFVGYGGGLLAKLNQARARGDWGSLATYLAVGLLVIIIIALLGYMGGQILLDFE